MPDIPNKGRILRFLQYLCQVIYVSSDYVFDGKKGDFINSYYLIKGNESYFNDKSKGTLESSIRFDNLDVYCKNIVDYHFSDYQKMQQTKG